MKQKYPKTNKEKADLYFNAMNEVRVRLRSVEQILMSQLPELIKSESCQLQLRLCCECFSVACLAAHRDFETHRAFRDEYNPVLIFKALEKSYPAFFPFPSLMKKTGMGHWHFDDIGQGNCITRLEIEGIWQKTGDQLHRASLKKYLKRTNHVDFELVRTQSERFWNLIAGHMLVLTDKKWRMHVTLERYTDQMACQFLNLNDTTSTAVIEVYQLQV